MSQLLSEQDMSTNDTASTNINKSNQYTSLPTHRINHSSIPRHRGKQKSFFSLATELTHYTRLSSHQSANTHVSVEYSKIVSVISAYSSFIPQDNKDLLQIEYTFDKTKPKPIRIFYTINIILFILFYILLLFNSTVKVARYLILIISLSLSLTFTMKPTYISFKPYEKYKFPLNQSTVPIICVLLLCISQDQYFTFTNAWQAMRGIGDIKPWAVLGVLFGLCYLCITLDLTGILKGLAKKTADASNSYQQRLFLYIFIFAAILTIITNNDISIVCLTPLVCSTANSGNIDSTPFIFMVLFTSNTFSMLLITGNPANLIVSEAASLTYLGYVKYMILPTIISGIILYIELYVMFRKQLRKRFQVNMQIETWKDLIKLPKYAIFCSIRLVIACIGIPIVGQLQIHHKHLKDYPLDMFVVLGIAVVSLFIDLLAFDIRLLAQFASTNYSGEYDESLLENYKQYNKLRDANNSNLMKIDDDMPYVGVELSGGMHSLNTTTVDNTMIKSGVNNIHNTLTTRVTHETFHTYDSNALLYDKLKLKIETFATDALWELPWKLIPFVFGLFIMVGFMGHIGLVKQLASMLKDLASHEWLVIFVVGFVSTILCQMVNNQPMTVLLSSILATIAKEYKDKDEPIPKWLEGSYFALVIGANLGGNVTPIASLAVLMWRGILEKWNIHMKYIGFSKRGFAVTPILVAICVFVIAIEVTYF